MKINGFKTLIFAVSLIFGCSIATQASAKQAEPSHDIRILVDVSGSMKWNDPNNLRTPALRLLANLLPNNAQAGVWTFGQYVNMLVPIDKVDKKWKQRATAAAGEIHSKGLFTNIEGTLGKSTWDWKRKDPSFQRTIILLTDGLVDIDKRTEKNGASKKRIIDSIIPRLASAGVTIHTIALSGEADEMLLQQLAAASGGWYEKAESAENLERIFFRMFEKTTQPDTLPLIDNQIMVDSSIKEMTLLVFNHNIAKSTSVFPPKAQAFNRNSTPNNVSWHHESRYDLITISDPAPGNWKIDADVDPDNRVMVVTDLKMVTTSLPNNLYLDDEQPYYVSLTSEGEVITKSAFHRFVDITLEQTQDNQQRSHRLEDDGKGPDGRLGDGTYTLALDQILTEGRHELVTYADGTTFKREKRHLVNVYSSPVIATIEPEKILDSEIETLLVIPRADMINPDSMTMHASISDRSGEIQRIEIPRSSHTEWKLPLGNFATDQQHNITIDIDGRRPNGKPVQTQVGPVTFGRAPPATEETTPLPEPAAEETSATQTATAVTADEPPVDDAINWIAVMIPFVMFNLLLAGGIYFGYKKWKSRPTPTQEKPWEALAHE